MLNEENSAQVLEYLRQKVQESGFESLDSHAMLLVVGEERSDESRASPDRALRAYLKIVSALLRSIGKSRFCKAKENLAKILELENISIELDMRSLDGIFPGRVGETIELDGFEKADEIAEALEAIDSEIDNLPEPEQDNSGPKT